MSAVRDELGRVLCHHGRPIQCLECGEEYAAELTGNGAQLVAESAIDPVLAIAGKEQLRASESDLHSESGVVGLAPPSPPTGEKL